MVMMMMVNEEWLAAVPYLVNLPVANFALPPRFAPDLRLASAVAISCEQQGPAVTLLPVVSSGGVVRLLRSTARSTDHPPAPPALPPALRDGGAGRSGGGGGSGRMWETLQGWLQYCVEWAAKDPYGFLSTVLLALSPFFLASAALSWKLAKAIEARDRDAKKKAKRQENVLRSRNKGRKAE
ncbi:unnamed protein product [Lampetra fluviatilis]